MRAPRRTDDRSPGRAHFFKEEVLEAYDAMEDTPDWRRHADPWRFYRPKAIIERQERWAREDAEARGEDEDEDGLSDDELQSPYVRSTPKIGRNDPCPCGSGKKYKKCCLADQ